jgi:hypothetical protein
MAKKANIKEIKPFKQIPYCEDNALLSITPKQFEVLQSALNIFKEPIIIMDEIFNQNIDMQNIKIKYVQGDGTEITKEEAEEYLLQASSIIKEKTS